MGSPRNRREAESWQRKEKNMDQKKMGGGKKDAEKT